AVDGQAPLTRPRLRRPFEDPLPAGVEQAPPLVGQGVTALAADPARLEPALPPEPGHEHPHDILPDAERRQELDERPQPDLPAVVADVLPEEVEDDRPQFHAAQPRAAGRLPGASP